MTRQSLAEDKQLRADAVAWERDRRQLRSKFQPHAAKIQELYKKQKAARTDAERRKLRVEQEKLRSKQQAEFEKLRKSLIQSKGIKAKGSVDFYNRLKALEEDEAVKEHARTKLNRNGGVVKAQLGTGLTRRPAGVIDPSSPISIDPIVKRGLESARLDALAKSMQRPNCS